MYFYTVETFSQASEQQPSSPLQASTNLCGAFLPRDG